MKKKLSAAVFALSVAFASLSIEDCLFMTPVSEAALNVEHKDMVYGHALQPGDTIGILAPAGNTDMDSLGDAVKFLEGLGYKVKLAPSCRSKYGYFAGTDMMRATDINNYFNDDEVDAILCLRGGYGSARILDKLNYDAIRRHPKLFIGFSDITALHAALEQGSHLVTLHGPMLTSFKKKGTEADYSRENFAKAISGDLYPGEIHMPKGRALKGIKPGKAEGKLIGGNLSVLTSLLGTPYELKGDGEILLLEDVGEDTYRVDRMLQQLWQNGLLLRVNGVVVGDMIGAEDDYEEGDFHLDEVLTYYANLSGKPWLKGLPVGHGKDNLCLPLGSRTVMEVNDDGTAKFYIDEVPLVRKE